MPEISLFMAFAAGVASFLSPCVLPLVPGYVSYISGVSFAGIRDGDPAGRRKRGVVLSAVFFVLGFLLVFVLLGASATWIGAFLSFRGPLLSKIAGLVIVFFGIYKMGLIRANFMYREARFQVGRRRLGHLGAMVIGAAFAFGWTPCIGPILGGILAYAATLEQVNRGMLLLAVYAAGLGIPFLLTAVGLNYFGGFFARTSKYLRHLEVATGAVMVVLGVLIYTNKLVLIPGLVPFLNRFAL